MEWKVLPKDVREVILSKMYYMEMVKLRIVSKEWKRLIDKIIKEMNSYRILDDVVKVTVQDSESNSNDISESYWCITYEATVTLRKQFTQRFIKERVSLFNDIHKTKIDANSKELFGSVDEIRIGHNEFSTFMMQSEIFVDDSDFVSHFTMRNKRNPSPQDEDKGWKGVGSNWFIEDCTDVIRRWTNRCHDNDADCIGELYGTHTLEDLSDEHRTLLEKHTWIDHGPLLVEGGYVRVHLLEYIVFMTQQFLDRHNLDWRTFSYLRSDIDRLLNE